MAYHAQSLFELLVHDGELEAFKVQGFRRNKCYTCAYYILGVLSFGLIFLLGYWYPVKLFIYTHSPCDLTSATSVLIKQFDISQYFISQIHNVKWTKGELTECMDGFAEFEKTHLSGNFRYFEHMFLRYYFNKDSDQINELSGFDNLSVKEIYDLSVAVTSCSKNKIYGENYINVPVKSALVIFFQLAANPFYVFQVASFILWYLTDYIIYPSIILCLTFISLVIATWDTRKHLLSLHNMVGKETIVKVLKNKPAGSVEVYKSSKELVPGDLIVIPSSGMEIPCDMVLLHGCCTVNESSLTGEGFPASKTSLDSITSSNENIMEEIYSVAGHKNHTLYNGTEVIQATAVEDVNPTALVVSTGFSTVKGRLIKSIIFPKPVHFAFFRDSMRFVFCLFILAVIGFVYSAVMLHFHNVSGSDIALRAFDIITIIVSPALPTCMTISLMYAVKRLKKNQIFCIDSARVNVCGKLKMFVFDKTGTLTEDTLAISGIIPAYDGLLDNVVHNADSAGDIPILRGMASCHTLSALNGEISGDPLDHYMFTFTKWKLSQSPQKDAIQLVLPPPYGKDEAKGLKIIKQFPFQSSLQRMSVITKDSNLNYVIYSKGSPEMILSMCTKHSKPKDIFDILEQNTRNGYRVLALATKTLSLGSESVSKVSRSDVECDLHFLGLIVFENLLKPISSQIVDTLLSSNIRVSMATGDNLFTAVSVAHKVGIIKPYQKTVSISFKEDNLNYEVLEDGQNDFVQDKNYANPWSPSSLGYTIVLTGETYILLKEKYPDVCQKVLVAGSVFARMSPDQKTDLINDLKVLGYGVGMCGDGANDCGALKAAHAGIALSTSEASVAAPFTSKVFDISCVPTLICEGRSSLVTSFSAFRYLALYCFIQFIGVLLLYSVRSAYADYQYLYADLILCFPLTIFMVQAEASNVLIKRRPPGRLFHPIFLGTIMLQILIQLIFQLGAFFYVRSISWYESPEVFDNGEFNFVTFENYSVVILSFYQYIWLSFVCYPGRPFNKVMYTNIKYSLSLIALIVLTLVIHFVPSTFFRELFEFKAIPSNLFKVALLFIALFNLFISYVVETYLRTSRFFHLISRKILRKTGPRNQYKNIIDVLHVDSSWPPLFK